MTQNPTDLSTVTAWLKALGCTPEPFADPHANWHVVIGYPVGHPNNNKLELLNPKASPRAIVIATKAVLSNEHRAAFADLENDSREEFLAELANLLNREYVEFQIEQDPANACPLSFSITAMRFDDGLTLDSFNRTVSSVFKAQFAAMLCIRRHLGSPPSRGGSEFEFRKVGIQ